MKIFIVGKRATLPRQLSACRGLSWAASLIARIGAIGDKRSLSEQLTAIRTINRQSGWIFAGTDRPAYQCLYEMADNHQLMRIRNVKIHSGSNEKRIAQLRILWVPGPNHLNWPG